MWFNIKDIKIKTAYRNIIFVLSAVIIVLICSIMLFLSYFNNSFSAMYGENFYQKHKYISENIKEYEYELWQQGSYILGNSEVSLVLNGADTNVDTKYRAIKNIKDIGTMLGVRSFNIVNEEERIFRDGTSLEAKPLGILKNIGLDEYYEEYKSGKNFFVNEDKSDVIYFYDDYRGYTVIFTIDYADFIEKMKFPQMDAVEVYYKNSEPLIVNGNGETDNSYEKLANKLKGEKGHFRYDGKLWFYANINSVICLSGITVGRALREAFFNASFIWIFAILLMIAAGIAVRYVSDMFQKVKTAAEQTRNSRNEMSVIKLFTNRETTEEEDETLGAIFGSNHGYFAAFLIIVDSDNNNTDEKAICRLADNILSTAGKSISVRISRREIGTLYKTKDMSNIKEIANLIKQNAKEQYGITVSIIKGRTTEEMGEMFGGINELSQVSSYRFITGFGSVIDADEVKRKNEYAEYPIDIQRLIIDSCKNGDLKSAESQFKAFIAYIAENDYTMAENWTIMLFINIMRNMERYENMIDFKTVNMIISNDTFESSVNCFMNYLNEKMMLHEDEHETEFIKDIKRMTEENYGDMSFDLNYVAREFDITSVHASRKFKKLTGQNFSKYLSEYRLEKACKKLTETELKVSEIAEICGFGSTTYFGSAFKKYTQMTPQEYRASNK